MIFEALNAAADRNELLLLSGLLCHYHKRRDGQVTICELIVVPHCRGRGLGRFAIHELSKVPGATSLLAKCPADLAANGFYEHLGFALEATQHSHTGRAVNVWRLAL